MVHHCGFNGNGTQTDWSAGIWGGWFANKLTFQYNEAYNHYFPAGDGEGFDIDSYSPNSIYQFNYSHDNQGGFMLTMGDNNHIDSSVVRYNISLNEIIGDWRGGDYIWVYNNIFARTDTITSAYPHYNTLKANFVYNNIFYSASGTQVYTVDPSATHSNNLYFPAGTLAESNAVTSDPQFVNAPTTAPLGRLNITGLKLKATSPAINAGLAIANNGGLDYWGSKLYNGLPDIGAQEYYDPDTVKIIPVNLAGSLSKNLRLLDAYIANKTPVSVYDISGQLILSHVIFKSTQEYFQLAGNNERRLILNPEK